MKPDNIHENDLHAFIDGALPDAECDAVAALLAENTTESGRVRDYRAQKQAIKTAFDPILDEPIPAHLLAVAQNQKPASTNKVGVSTFDRWSLQRLAAGFLITLLGGAAGWIVRDATEATESQMAMVSLPRQAAIAHAVFTPDVRRPVEVSGQQEEQLVTWLSKRIGTPIKAPKLAKLGYELVGGRLLPGNIGPVAQFMYQDTSGERLTLYVSTENTANHETAFRFAQEGSINVFYWIDGKFGYALSGAIDREALGRLASAVYEQIEKP